MIHVGDWLAADETGWEWLAALAQKSHKPLLPFQSTSGINPLFQGDISRTMAAHSQSASHSQTFNPIFKAQHAQHEQLQVNPAGW